MLQAHDEPRRQRAQKYFEALLRRRGGVIVIVVVVVVVDVFVVFDDRPLEKTIFQEGGCLVANLIKPQRA